MSATAAETQVAGLRALADLIEANPEIAEHTRFTFDRLDAFAHGDDAAAVLAAMARAGKAAGHRVTKDFDDSFGGVEIHLSEEVSPFAGGDVVLAFHAPREQVCERIVTGTREVTETVRDPDAPKITRTRVEDVVEWRCAPLLADEAAEARS
jgi:hypothetical protein